MNEPFKAHILVPIDPMPKPRPRVVMRGGFATAYTPAKAKMWERQFSLFCLPHAPPKPMTGPVHVTIQFVKRRPRRLERKSDSSGLIWCPKTPDLDNCAKSVLDSLGLSGRWWRDDAQVSRMILTKAYAEKGNGPRVELWIEEIDGDECW